MILQKNTKEIFFLNIFILMAILRNQYQFQEEAIDYIFLTLSHNLYYFVVLKIFYSVDIIVYMMCTRAFLCDREKIEIGYVTVVLRHQSYVIYVTFSTQVFGIGPFSSYILSVSLYLILHRLLSTSL